MPIRIPADSEEHECCWMAWAVHAEWREWKEAVKEELTAVVHVIAQYEPVRLLTPRSDLADARARFSARNIEIVVAPVDDIWMRDIAPTFAIRNGDVVAIDWNFNGWGGTSDRPRRRGDCLAKAAKELFGVARITAPFVAEGGAFITDGQRTLVTTRSCLLNPNRNAESSGQSCENLIDCKFAELGIERVIWLEGDVSEPISSGHVDGYVMFTGIGNMLFQTVEDSDRKLSLLRKRDLNAIKGARNSRGRNFEVEEIGPPRPNYLKLRSPYYAPCYLNAYVANNAVITARFGDIERDEAANDALGKAFPGRTIVMVRIDHLLAGGGGVRCLTQPEPAISERLA